MQLVLVTHGCGTAFKIGDVRALVGNDQRALELACALGVHAKIGRQFHRAAHARRDVDKGPIGKHRTIQRGKEIVRLRHDRPQIFLHQLGVLMHGFGDRHEDHASLFELFLECCRHRYRVKHCIHSNTRAVALAHFRRRLRCAFNAQQHFGFPQRNAQFLVGFQNLRRHVIKRFIFRLTLGSSVIIGVLIVDGGIVHHRPGRLLHGQPFAIGGKAPLQQPFRLALLVGNEPNRVLGQTLGRKFLLDLGLETGVIFVRFKCAGGSNSRLVHTLLDLCIISHQAVSFFGVLN